jgi:hypothetical protein
VNRDVAERIMSEYRQLQGLRLTMCQAARLWALDADECEAVLHALVTCGRLSLDDKGQYGLPPAVARERSSVRRAPEAVA